MLKLIKFLTYFTISFFILSINVNDQSLFIHIKEFSDPYKETILEQGQIIGKKAFKKLKGLSKKLFSNSLPQESPTSSSDSNLTEHEKTIEEIYEYYPYEESTDG